MFCKLSVRLSYCSFRKLAQVKRISAQLGGCSFLCLPSPLLPTLMLAFTVHYIIAVLVRCCKSRLNDLNKARNFRNPSSFSHGEMYTDIFIFLFFRVSNIVERV